MVRLNVAIPDEVKSKLEARAAESGFASLESYIEAVLTSDAQVADVVPPAHLSPRDRDELNRLVSEGLQSPVRELTPADWDQMRRDLIARHRRPEAP
jgi:hypothetical protein